MLGFFFVDAIEGNEEALREEREKLRRRKAREERCAQTHTRTRGTRTHKHAYHAELFVSRVFGAASESWEAGKVGCDVDDI